MLSFGLLILMSAGVFGCGQEEGTGTTDEIEGTYLCYVNTEEDSLARESYEIQGETADEEVEDVLEEIFGDIEDEHDVHRTVEKKVGEGEYIFSCRLEVEYLNEHYDLGIEESDEYDTLAGYIIRKYEGIPAAGFREKTPSTGKRYFFVPSEDTCT